MALSTSSQVGLLCLGRKRWRNEEGRLPQARGSVHTDESAAIPARRPRGRGLRRLPEDRSPLEYLREKEAQILGLPTSTHRDMGDALEAMVVYLSVVLCFQRLPPSPRRFTSFPALPHPAQAPTKTGLFLGKWLEDLRLVQGQPGEETSQGLS